MANPILIPFALDIASQAMNQFGQQQLNQNNQVYNQMQQRMAYVTNLDMWNRTNAYNSPASQMQRLKEAGLNPNLIYGNINNTPATNSVKMEPLESKHQRVNWNGTSGLLASQAVRMNEAQIKQMEIQNRKLESETTLNDEKLNLTAALSLAKVLDNYVRYGFRRGAKPEYNISPESLSGYDLSIKQEIYNQIKARVQQLSLSNEWNKIKNDLLKRTGTNIDKDTSLERKASLIVSKIIEELGIPE
nr:MAG: DNA pilot protein [Microvirus sp.]